MPPVSRTYGPLHFEDLDPKRFEDLIRQLVYDFRQWRVLEATGRAGSDDGFDARGFEVISVKNEEPDDDTDNSEDNLIPLRIENDRQWLIQCKREKTITPKKLVKYLNEIPEEERKKLHGIIFVAACDFSKKAHDDFRAWCSQNSISEFYLWGKAQVEDFLYQPKNDGLLFAYFGISLQIRKRSIRTNLRTKLASKKKCEKILDASSGRVLLRDPTDERYPFLPDKSEKNKARWGIRRFLENNYEGVVIEHHKYFAYIDDERKHWDCVDTFNSSGFSSWENPWLDDEEDDKQSALRNKIWRFWYNLPERNRAWIVGHYVIPYEDILAIDDAGDDIAKCPHIYTEFRKYRGDEYLTSIMRGDNSRAYPDKDLRIKFFPDEFPEVENTVARRASDSIPVDDE